MTTDDPSSLPIPSDPEPEKNSPQMGKIGTFGDVDPSYELSPPQCRAIELALAGLRWSQIAASLEINRKTLWRWKTQDPNFQQALADARADRRDIAVDRCQALAFRAASVLANFLEDSDDKHRFRAAQLLLQAAARFTPPKCSPAPTPAPEPWPPPDLPYKMG
jgi:hypothetical protein